MRMVNDRDGFIDTRGLMIQIH